MKIREFQIKIKDQIATCFNDGLIRLDNDGEIYVADDGIARRFPEIDVDCLIKLVDRHIDADGGKIDDDDVGVVVEGYLTVKSEDIDEYGFKRQSDEKNV